MKWEYKVEDWSASADPRVEETRLNNLGGNGWEWVATIRLGESRYHNLYFKRPVPPTGDPS